MCSVSLRAEGSFRQQASAYSAKMQAELAQEREYSRSLESSFKEQAARFTQSLKVRTLDPRP